MSAINSYNQNRIVMNKQSVKLGMFDLLFLLFCLMPFILPNPIVTTDIQPYAALIGTIILFVHLYNNRLSLITGARTTAVIGLVTLVLSVVVMFAGEINVSAFRAVYNYYAVAVIPCATAIVVEKLGRFPEKQIKALILIWFAVATVQFFVYRGFAAFMISGARWSSGYRGVLGLASEPSFFGIACFYFLHMVQRFKRHRGVFLILVLFMGIVYAQSAMGILFIAAFIVAFLLENTRGWRGLGIWSVAGVALVVFLILLNTVLKDTRMFELYDALLHGGVEEVLSEDVSAETRAESITDALQKAFENYLLPMGYSSRIGSGYGGFLCELGFFALPILFCISAAMARTFCKPFTRLVYFILISVLLFNNTQIGNPLLLFVVGANSAFYKDTPADIAPQPTADTVIGEN